MANKICSIQNPATVEQLESVVKHCRVREFLQRDDDTHYPSATSARSAISFFAVSGIQVTVPMLADEIPRAYLLLLDSYLFRFSSFEGEANQIWSKLEPFHGEHLLVGLTRLAMVTFSNTRAKPLRNIYLLFRSGLLP